MKRRSDPVLSDGLEVLQDSPPDLLASRALATGRIFRGGFLTIFGTVAAAAVEQWELLGSGTMVSAVTVGGVVMVGVGLWTIGRAAKHLLRFGGLRGALLLGAFGGLGVSTMLFASAMSLVLLDSGPWLDSGLWDVARTVARIAAGGVLGFSVFLVLLTLQALLAWAWRHGDPEG